jgi:hypothetical protein
MQMMPLISERDPEGLAVTTHLGKLIARMEGVTVAYRLWIPPVGERQLVGWGTLKVNSSEGRITCRISGEVSRPSPFEYVFHHFWLTRRGMFVVVAGLFETRPPQERDPSEAFIQPVGPSVRSLRSEAEHWLARRRR